MLSLFSRKKAGGTFVRKKLMKTPIRFLLLVLFVQAWIPAKAQTITINLKNKTLVATNMDTLRKGDLYHVIIEDVNLNLYKVVINARDTVQSNELKVPDFTSFPVDGLSKLLQSVITSIAVPIRDEVAETINGRKEFLPQFKIVEIPDTAPDTLKKYANRLMDLLDRLSNINREFDKTFQKVHVLKLRYAHEFPAAYPQEKRIDAEELLKESIVLRDSFRAIRSEVQQGLSIYSQFAALNKLDSHKNYSVADKLLKDSYTETLNQLKNMDSLLSPTNLVPVLSSVVSIENNSTMQYKTLPIQYNGEAGSLNINISPRKPESNLSDYSTTFQFPKNLKYYGVTTSAYFSGLSDEVYNLKGDTAAGYTLVRENQIKNEIGVCALVTFGKKFRQENLGLHLQFGPALSLSSQLRPRMAYGAGLSFGRRQMLVLNGGGILGTVDKRSAAFEGNGPYLEKPSDVTLPVLSHSWFISLGYLFRF